MLIIVFWKILFICRKIPGSDLPGPRAGHGVEKQQLLARKAATQRYARLCQSYVLRGCSRVCVSHCGCQQGGRSVPCTVCEAPAAREQQHVTLAPPKTEFGQNMKAKVSFLETCGRRRSDTGIATERAAKRPSFQDPEMGRHLVRESSEVDQ